MNSTNVRKIDERGFSRNYIKLWAAGMFKSQICVCDYEPKQGSSGCRDVCHTIWDGNSMQVSARGIEYVNADDFEDFKEQCEKLSLTWIDSSENIEPDMIVKIWRLVNPSKEQDQIMVKQVGPYDIDEATWALKKFAEAVADYVK
ncbi:MAG: hypothetical protein M0R48_11655 [Candidatus Omnitrophica bacterium]|nr:hypothetical protein [Candidatus Omnitrophota bacterium]